MKDNLHKFFKGFRYAAQGIAYAVKTQINFRFHLTAAFWVLLLSQFYGFSKAEYGLLFLTIGSVLASELVNTAVEKAVDLSTDKEHPLAKAAKDTAAGAVLVSAAAAVCVGVKLFLNAAVFKEIAVFMAVQPVFIAITAVLAAVSLIFVFKGI